MLQDKSIKRKEVIEVAVRNLLMAIGENPDRPGLLDTPKRVSKMFCEIFRGYNKSEKPKITTFLNGTDGITYDQMIVDSGDFYSFCEHHMVPFFGKYWFAYIPNKKGRILGLSKVARVIDYHSAKLQVQERLVQDVVEDLLDALNKNTLFKARGMALVIQGEHLCKTMRGAKKKGKMTTIHLEGCFKKKQEVRTEFMRMIE